jgi:hypothetical protein
MVSDWDLACSAERFNLCLIGARETTSALMDQLRAHMSLPVMTASYGDSLELPPAGTPAGTVILFDVDELALADQQHLMEWLAQSPLAPRVISTAQGSLLAMIDAGMFLAALYYRLNVICVDARASEPLAVECKVPSAREPRMNRGPRFLG